MVASSETVAGTRRRCCWEDVDESVKSGTQPIPAEIQNKVMTIGAGCHSFAKRTHASTSISLLAVHVRPSFYNRLLRCNKSFRCSLSLSFTFLDAQIIFILIYLLYSHHYRTNGTLPKDSCTIDLLHAMSSEEHF